MAGVPIGQPMMERVARENTVLTIWSGFLVLFVWGRRTVTVTRRLRNLRNLEWFNIFELAAILLWLVPARVGEDILADTWQRTLAYLPAAALLAVGGWYWHLKLRQVRDGRPLGDAPRALRRLGQAALIVLCAATGLLMISWVTRTGRTADRIWAAILLVLGSLEYVNYFHRQLMYDTRADLRRLLRRRRLAKSSLRRDLERYRRRTFANN
jgi:hypothetical protein